MLVEIIHVLELAYQVGIQVDQYRMAIWEYKVFKAQMSCLWMETKDMNVLSM
jgi:hypothetical protein